MTKKIIKPVPQWVDYVCLTLIVGVEVILRSLGQVSSVFFNGQVIFRETDPFYQVRLAENMAHNGLSMLRWDYFAQYPNGAPEGYGPIISWVINITARIVSANPSDYLIDTIAAWLPVVAAGLLCVVVYFLASEVFKSRFVGLASAGLVAIIPSELLHRSLLGFTDHHILEVLFSSLAILCLIKANRLKSWLWLIGFGLSFWLYCINWIGWPILALIIFVWAFAYFGVTKVTGKRQRWIYFGIPIGLVILAILIIPQARDYFIAFMSNMFLGFTGTIEEVKPVSPRDYYLLYNIAGVLAIGGIIFAVKHKVNSLFLVWAIFFIVASITEKRWGYYSTIGIAIFAGYFLYWIGTKVKEDWKPYIMVYCCLAIIFPTYPYALGISKRPVDIDPGWYQSCVWLRDNTPEPFNNPNAYYSRDTSTPLYGVFTWWDYGHYIIQISHRVPLSSPTQQECPYYAFFTEDNETVANEILKDLNVKYVLIDDLMVGAKFYAIWNKVKRTQDGWNEGLFKSQIYKMYSDKSETWKLVQQFGSVKIFERT
jgi:asparagine N-glycosylation enzyme membrane subunit Stt3